MPNVFIVKDKGSQREEDGSVKMDDRLFLSVHHGVLINEEAVLQPVPATEVAGTGCKTASSFIKTSAQPHTAALPSM